MKECKDCVAEGRPANLPVLNLKHLNGKPVPGPRCHNHWQAHQKAVKAASAGRRVAKTYSLTPEQYATILAAQNGVCYICLRPPRPGGKRLAVDHDHRCCPGKISCGRCVRGLICWSDNKWLHHMGDDPDLVHRAWEYLRNPPAHIALRAGNV